jgi:hypothetical protein
VKGKYIPQPHMPSSGKVVELLPDFMKFCVPSSLSIVAWINQLHAMIMHHAQLHACNWCDLNVSLLFKSIVMCRGHAIVINQPSLENNNSITNKHSNTTRE